ncbi:hypothetical protein M407DRAFT_72949 [Tulasnella calospora MUT 4182]|uniref:Cytochrome P450 n=1 Tax=Tulasnella calospora MUT 4182 TaxID=1051891 RepID=A0A0C3QLQ6_9AGAM|nr:hypothetical protein M407DRAFT_72949 [Tulasnella calospora MUT 4182]
MPKSKFAITWSKFGEEYGPLTWLTIPGQNILVINSIEAAKELLDKRASNSVERPRFTMANELLGMSKLLSISGYNDMWRKQRSHLKHALSAAVVRRDYSSLLEMKAQQYLERCAARPENFLPETTRIIGETIIQLSYGKLEDGRGRDYIQISTRMMEVLAFAVQGHAVDLLPPLRHLPSWLPGMKFKRQAAQWKKEIKEVEDTVSELAKENMLSDDPDVRSSFMFKKMEELSNEHEEGQDVQQQENQTMLAYSGLATETAMESFIRAMTLFPSVQENVQAEIDKVVGSSRFPTFKDQSDLPYLHAVILETLRWNPVVSFGIPHASREDDVYNGYFIPKGTTIIANAWGFSRNEKHYTNPSNFDPERYLKQPPELDPREFVFGYGRRICPGKDLAYQKIWILAATILWALRLVEEEGEDPACLADGDRFSFAAVR